MADRPLFNLDANGRWRRAYDKYQWIIQRRDHKPSVRTRARDAAAIRDSGYRGQSFICCKKATVDRLFREKGVVLTPEAQKQLDALPNEFLDFLIELRDLSPPVAAKRAA